jgi:hypothetical protein
MDTCTDIAHLKKELRRIMSSTPDGQVEAMQKSYKIELIKKRIKELEEELSDLR